MRSFRGDDPVELGHARRGEIWFVRQGASMVASYGEVRELRNQDIRLGRFLGLLGCLGIVIIGGRTGVLRLRAGPPCASPICRILDLVTLGALVVAAVGIGLRDLGVALWATVGAFLSLIGGIGWGRARGHTDASAFKTRLLQGCLGARLHELGDRCDRWVEEFNPPKGSVTFPWRVIALVRGGCAVIGSFAILGATLGTIMSLVMTGADDAESLRVMTGFFLFGLVLAVLAAIPGRPLRKAAASENGRTWLGWIILLSPPLLLFLLAVT